MTIYIKTDESNKFLLENICKNKDFNFNNWFNTTFDKLNIIDDDVNNGYGDWLKKDNIIPQLKNKNLNTLHETIEQEKYNLSKIIKTGDINNLNYSDNFSELNKNVPERYSSNIFNKLQYEDLKKAHSESVIPVTEEDYHNRKKYTSIDHINRDRTQDIINNDSHLQSHTQLMSEKQLNDDNISIQRAYKLMNQDEKIRQNYNTFWSDLRRIKNS